MTRTHPALLAIVVAAIAGVLAVLADLWAQIRRDGVRATWESERWRLRAALDSEQELIVLVKDLSEITEPAFEGDLRLEDVEARHLPALHELNRRRMSTRTDRRFADWVDRGYHGYVAFRGEQAVGYYWWVDRSAVPPHPDLVKLGLQIELGAGDVYGCDYFLLEEHRGGGTSIDFLYRIERDLRERGFDRIWGYVVADNRPARWLYTSRGYLPIRKIAARTRLLRRRTQTVEIKPMEATA
jgi:GNAT superfamily N-acetyltransferase